VAGVAQAATPSIGGRALIRMLLMGGGRVLMLLL